MIDLRILISMVLAITLIIPCNAFELFDVNNSSNISVLYPNMNLTFSEAIYLMAYSNENPNVTSDGIVTFRNNTTWKIKV